MADGLFGTGARVSPLKQTSIQPTGIPGSTFVRAPVREAGGNLQALAQALGGLNQALQNYASVTHQKDKDPNSRHNKEWVALREQMGREDLINEIKNGTYGNQIQQDAVEMLLADRANSDFRAQILEWYNTGFDQTSGNFAEEYERKRQEFAAGLPSEISKGQFYRLTAGHFQSWLEEDTKAKAAFAREGMNTTIVDGFRTTIEDLTKEGKSPDEIAAALFAKSADNREFLGLSGQDQNETIFKIAEEFALQGHEDIARALLEGERTGADGRSLPSLRNTNSYTTRVLGLLEKAGNIRDQNVRDAGGDAFHEDNQLIARGEFTKEKADQRVAEGLYGSEKAMSLVEQSDAARARAVAKAEADQVARENRIEHFKARDAVLEEASRAMDTIGGINDIEDVEITNQAGTGTVTLTKDQIVKELIARKEEDFDALQSELVERGEDPDKAKATADRLRMEWYAGSNLVNKEWQNTLNGMASVATVDGQQRGEISGYMRQGATLFRQLKEINPAYLSTVLTNDKAKEFFTAYEDARYVRRMSEEDALQWAAFRQNSKTLDRVRMQMKQPEVEKTVDRALRGMGADRDNTMNTSVVADRVRVMAEMGMSHDSIQEKLEEELAQTTVNINGVLVAAHRALAPDFPELVLDEFSARFEQYAESHGIGDPSDLVLVASGSEDKWMVVDKQSGMPVGRPITASTLNTHRERRKTEAAQRFEALQAEDAAARAKAKQEYDDQIAKERGRIAHWRNLASKSARFRNVYTNKMADDLQKELDDRLANDQARLRMAEQENKRRQNLRVEEQRTNGSRVNVTGKKQGEDSVRDLADQDRKRAEGLGLGQRWDDFGPN